MNQLATCQLEDNEVFQIHVKIHNEQTEKFIQQSPNPLAWETSYSGKVMKLKQLNICANDPKAFIEYMQDSYNNMHKLHWVHPNKIKYNESKVCEDSGNSYVNK